MIVLLLLLGPVVWTFGFSLIALALAVLSGSWRAYAIRGPILIVSASRPLRWVTEKITRLRPRCFTWQCFMFTWEDLRDTQTGPWAHYDKVTLRHELAHTKQALLFGLAWPLVYLGASAVAIARGKHWYVENYFERQARRAEVEL